MSNWSLYSSSQSIKPVLCSQDCNLEWPVNPFGDLWFSVSDTFLHRCITKAELSVNTTHSMLLLKYLMFILTKYCNKL